MDILLHAIVLEAVFFTFAIGALLCAQEGQ